VLSPATRCQRERPGFRSRDPATPPQGPCAPTTCPGHGPGPGRTAADPHALPVRGPAHPADAGKVTDVPGTLQDCDGRSFSVRTARGELAVVPGERALAGKVGPPAR